jgi:hypothetical protein
MVYIKLVEKKPISVGQGNLNCPLHDAHEERVYQVNGKTVRVYVDGESASQWMNKMTIELGFATVPVGKKSKAVVMPSGRGWGVWLNVDQQGFSQCHLWVIGDEELEYDELYFLVQRLEKEFERELEQE